MTVEMRDLQVQVAWNSPLRALRATVLGDDLPFEVSGAALIFYLTALQLFEKVILKCKAGRAAQADSAILIPKVVMPKSGPYNLGILIDGQRRN